VSAGAGAWVEVEGWVAAAAWAGGVAKAGVGDEKKGADYGSMIHRSYVIIGCGHFGGRAAEKLQRKDPLSKIIVVDKNKEAIKKSSRLSGETVID
jgi:hypothetical protein